MSDPARGRSPLGSSHLSLDGSNRKRGRPRGSRDSVIKGKPFSADQFAAVRAFLMGIDPSTACRQYLLQEEPPNSSEEALSKLARLMDSIAAQGLTRPAGPDQAINVANKNAATAMLKASIACSDVVRDAKKKRADERIKEKAKRKADAEARGLAPLPLRGGPKLPEVFANLKVFEADYDKKHRLDPLDHIELQARFEEDKSAWYASQGYHYEPQYEHTAFADQVPMSALSIVDAKTQLRIDGAVQSAAARGIGLLTWTVQRKPEANDLLSAWIGGTTLTALNNHGVLTLYSAVDLVKRRGNSWWKQVPGLGPTRADRMKMWLLEVGVKGFPLYASDFDSIQVRRLKEIQASDISSTPLPSLAALDLTPLQPWISDESLSGRHGIFRRLEANMLKAETDIDALIVTLNKYKDKRATLKVYAREICRFCLWSYRVKALPLSSIGVEEAREYREFLAAIPAEWISESRDADPRSTKAWRPFRGQLDEVSQRKALTSISVIFKQLHESGYLTGHPMASVLKQAGLAKPKADVNRSLSLEQWAVMLKVQKAMEAAAESKWKKGPKLGTDPRPGIRRVNALIHLLQSTGLRRDEVYKARLGHMRKIQLDGKTGYLLSVTGKRSKVRDILIHKEVLERIMSHLNDRPSTFNDEPKTPEGRLKVPLISVIGAPLKAHQFDGGGDTGAGGPATTIKLNSRGHANPEGSLSTAGMLSSLKRFFAECASMEGLSEDDRSAFNQATTHWMRHTFGHSMMDANVDIRVVQSAMGHSSINTTANYSKSNTEQLVRGLRHGQSEIERSLDSKLLELDGSPTDDNISFSGETGKS